MQIITQIMVKKRLARQAQVQQRPGSPRGPYGECESAVLCY